MYNITKFDSDNEFSRTADVIRAGQGPVPGFVSSVRMCGTILKMSFLKLQCYLKLLTSNVHRAETDPFNIYEKLLL